MKKLILVIAILVLAVMGASAAPGDYVTDIIETDILTYINGKPINSYNIRGQTVVLVEELCNNDTGIHYGFTSAYDESTRTLTLDTDFTTGNANATVERGKNGGVVGTVIETDIKVYFNSIEITGYNIRGKTAICVEEMGAYTPDEPNAQFGYSKYLCAASWHESSRELYLNTFLEEKNFFGNYPSKKFKFELKDNQLSCSFDQLNPFSNSFEINLSDDFKKECYIVKPVFMGEEHVGLMVVSPAGLPILTMNEMRMHKQTSKLDKILSYGESIKYINDNFNVVTETQDDNASIFLAKKDNVHYLLFAMKNGGLICDGKYDSSYSSVKLVTENGVPTLQLKSNAFSGSMPVSTYGYNFYDQYEQYISGSISDADRLSTRIGTATVVIDEQAYTVSAILPHAYNKNLMVDINEICNLLDIDCFIHGGIFYITSDHRIHTFIGEFDPDSGKLPASVDKMTASTAYVDEVAKTFTYNDGISDRPLIPYYIKGNVYVPLSFFADAFKE